MARQKTLMVLQAMSTYTTVVGWNAKIRDLTLPQLMAVVDV